MQFAPYAACNLSAKNFKKRNSGVREDVVVTFGANVAFIMNSAL